MAMGSSPYTVSASKSPRSRRTHRPPCRSMAGMMRMILHSVEPASRLRPAPGLRYCTRRSASGTTGVPYRPGRHVLHLASVPAVQEVDSQPDDQPDHEAQPGDGWKLYERAP